MEISTQYGPPHFKPSQQILKMINRFRVNVTNCQPAVQPGEGNINVPRFIKHLSTSDLSYGVFILNSVVPN